MATTTILTGHLVATDRRGDRNTRWVQVIADAAGVTLPEDTDLGWQLAETFGGQGKVFRFVRITDRWSRCRNWGQAKVYDVEMAEVDTIVEGGRIMARPGAPLPTGMVRWEARVA